MGKKRDTAANVLADPRAPQGELFDARSELQKAHMPRAGDLLPPEPIMRVIRHIQADLAEQEMMAKARGPVVIPFPTERARMRKKGMQSLFLDDLQLSVMGDYFEKPGPIGFDAMRQMVEQTPVLNAVVLTRIRQVQRFCSPLESEDGPGFEIRHVDRDHKVTDEEKQSMKLLSRFFTNCGWEFNPRARRRLRRDNFSQFMAKLVRDSLTLDSAPIETEFKRDRTRGIDGFYAVDGSTIRLCTESGYQGDDEVFALQVVQGRIRTAYTRDELIYEPRNPRTDVTLAGYGLSETELLIRVVTGFLNAMTLNIKGFSENSIPKGILHMVGDYNQDDLDMFKRYWNGMVRGVNNAWTLPVMVSKDQEGKAEFVNTGTEFNEMYFSKWMTFLASMICAIYGMSPEEINFESFSSGKSALSGSDTEEKIALSQDKGLRPLMSYAEQILSDFICSDFSDKYVFRWSGLEETDQDKRHELKKLVATVDEVRGELNMKPSEDKSLGKAPVNPALVAVWQQSQQAQGAGDFGAPPGGAGGFGDGQGEGQDAGDGDDQRSGGSDGDGGGRGPASDTSDSPELQKALPTGSAFRVGSDW